MRSGPLSAVNCLLTMLLPWAVAQRIAAPPVRVIVEGTIVNSVSGAPVTDAIVKLMSGLSYEAPQAPPILVHTDSAGHFEFTGLPATNYSLDVRRPGLVLPDNRPNGSELQLFLPRTSIAPKEFRPGATVGMVVQEDGAVRETVVIKLTPAAVIAGRVTDPSGAPLRHVMVTVYSALPQTAGPWTGSEQLPDGSQLRLTGRQSTDDRGEFRAGSLMPGRYYVAAERPPERDNSFQRTFFPNALGAAAAKPLDLVAGQEVRAEIQTVRTSGVRVAGKLVFPEIAGVDTRKLHTQVELLVRDNSQARALIGTFADGQFEVAEVPPGAYTMVAWSRDPQHWNGREEAVVAGIAQIEVGNGALQGLTLEMHPLPEIPGSIGAAAGCPSERMAVGASGAWSSEFVSTEGAKVSNGSFVLSFRMPSHYRLSVPGPYTILSARLAGIDVLKDGFDYPIAGPAAFELTVGCNSAGRAK